MDGGMPRRTGKLSLSILAGSENMNIGQISVLMAVYNCEATIRESIDSILAQTYTNWQFVICDDCSTDGTPAILEEYAQSYPGKFVLLRNEKNVKLAASLNHCLQYAQGEFCARMDGDDYADPTRFEKQVAFLREHPDIQLVGTLMQTFNEKRLGRIVPYVTFPDKFELRFGPCFAHATIMTYTAVYQSLGGYTVSKRTVRTQDYDLWFRFYAKGYHGANLQEALYFVREDENAFLRRKAKLYLWATVTRWKGFRMLHYPLKYYPRVCIPLVAMIYNCFRKGKARISLLRRK